MMWLLTAALVLLLTFLYLSIVKPHKYWYKRKIPHIKPWPIIGNMACVVFQTKPLPCYLQDLYNKYQNLRYFGFYQFSSPVLVIKDIDLIKQITIKDFDSFTDHMDMLPQNSDPFWDKNLSSMTGKRWHAMRCVLSPAFTSSKIKAMFYLIQECAQDFVKYFEKQSSPITLEMKDTFMRITNDIIASTAYGIKCDSLNDKDNEFFSLGKTVFNFSGLRALVFFGNSISPTLMKLFKVQIFDRKIRTFFAKIVKETIAYREKTGIIRMDMIHLLREAQKGKLQNDDKSKDMQPITKPEITDDDIVAQALVFFLGGFDTVSSTLSLVAYALAINQDVQDILIKEVDETMKNCNGQLTYDVLLGMQYLDMVISETQRLWPQAIFLNRKCVKPFTIEPQLPEEKPLHLEPGTIILVPTFAIHRDPQYYPSPNKFDPERFNEENKKNIPVGAYLPFGLGPRICIASRFATLEMKVVIFYILTKFKFVPVEKTEIPFNMSKKIVGLANDKGNWIGLEQRYPEN